MAIDITGLDKAQLLYRLVQRTRPLGLGLLAASSPFTLEDARRLVGRGGRLDFDYVAGRPLKVDITSNWMEEFLYDRDAGARAAQEVVNDLRTETNRRVGTTVPDEEEV